MTQANNEELIENTEAENLQESQESEANSKDSSSKLIAELETLKKDLANMQDKYLRSLADFDNFKKRAQKERSELLKYQGEQIVVDLLRVVDDFDLAMQFVHGQSNEQNDPEKFRQGMELIYKNLCEVLGKWEIKGESALGKAFDPVKHLAISRVASPDASPGTVVSELKKAFFYKDKIIRVGEVVVATEASS